MPTLTSLTEKFDSLRNDYAAAKQSRFRRRRDRILPLGSNADWHYRIPLDFYRTMEEARDMDRNDCMIGATIDRAVDNTIQDGFTLDPQTPDHKWNEAVRQDWQEWANDPQQCDVAGEYSFWEMEFMTLRACFVDGDAIVLPNMDSGALECVEAHRLRTPRSTTRYVVHGVLLDKDTRRRLEYWLCKQDVPLSSTVQLVSDILPYPTYDREGNRQVFHPYVSKRVSQTRGVTALAPVFDLCGMFEDTNFATLLRQQVAACFALIRERDLNFSLDEPSTAIGPRHRRQSPNGGMETLENVGPGMHLTSNPGERLRMDSPHVPSPEYLPHMKMILTLIGINLGMPLVMLLMDASETNFSGWRGAIQQAQMGFRHNQRRYERRFHRPIYRWWLDWKAASDTRYRSQQAALGREYYRHRWHKPTWAYIQPLQDAGADLLRLRNGLISPRRRAAERGVEYGQLVREICHDNARMIRRAQKTAELLNQKYPKLNVTWREIASLPTPDGVSIRVMAQGDPAGDDPAPGTPPAKSTQTQQTQP
ncbi:MAG: phage portal protein [Thermoguttaceae bacterium]|jgi:lambda family phage portal protein